MGTFSFIEFFREGGWGMWPVLLFGTVAVAASLGFAFRPRRGCIPFFAALWLTILGAVLHALVTDLAAVFNYLGQEGSVPPEQLTRMLLVGLKESSRPCVLGGFFLTLVPLFTAIGLLRRPFYASCLPEDPDKQLAT